MGSLSCEYIFDPVGIIDPAPDCIKELVVNYTCPNHEMRLGVFRCTPFLCCTCLLLLLSSTTVIWGTRGIPAAHSGSRAARWSIQDRLHP